MSSNYFGQFEIHQIGGSQPEIHVEFSDKQVASDFLAVQMSVYDRIHAVQYQLHGVDTVVYTPCSINCLTNSLSSRLPLKGG